MISLSSQKQSNAWHYLHMPHVREVFFGGGARSGKSILLCAHEIYEASKWPGTRGLICREDFTALQDSTMKTFFEEVMPMFGFEPGEHFTFNGQEKTVSWGNGSETLFRHMKYVPSDPNYSRIGSTAFTRVAIDEADEVGERGFELLRVRTGYKEPPHGGKILVTGNPGEYWTKFRYLYNKKNEPVTLREDQRVVLSTVADNPDKVARERYTQLLTSMTDEYDKARLLHGDWLIQPRTGMEFFPDFSSTTHCKAIDYNPDKALHITFDFNSAPYMTLLVAQIHQLPQGKWQVAFLKEYTPAHPFSTPKAACQMLVRDLREGCFKGHKAGLMYYGDASGKNSKSTERETVTHDYETITNELRYWVDGRSDMVLRRNPPHTKARDFMAHCFTGRLPIEIVIHPDMHTTVSDLVHLKQGPDGDILKEMAVDPVTKVKYERWGHCSQAVYYLAISAFKSVYDEMEEIAG